MKSSLHLLVGLLWVLSPVAAINEPDGESRFLSNIRQVTFEGRRAGEGYFGPRGDYLVFQSEREDENPFFQIYLLDLETGDTSRLSPGFGKTTCAWIHPASQKVLFASTHADPQARLKQQDELKQRESGRERRYSWDYDEHYDLYVAHLDNDALQRITEAAGYDAEASWSPDGRHILFSSNRHAYEKDLSVKEKEMFEIDKSYFVDLYIMKADGTEVRRLTDSPGYDGGGFFSPDGERIIWRRFSEDGSTAEVFSMTRDGSDVRQITRMGVMSWAPFYHPSGDYLVFSTNLQGFANFEIYMVDALGETDPVRVTHTDGFDGLPTFSPDGKTLAWTSTRTADGSSQIFFADWSDGAAREALGLDFSSLVTDPAVSADDLRLHVSFLASEETGGRLAGSSGARLAEEYAARHFERLGLEPAGDSDTYYQEFEFTSGVSLGEDNRLRISFDGIPKDPAVKGDWIPLAFSEDGEFESAPVVFAGYGIVAPETENQEEYDSYTHLEVEGKWVLVLRYLPEDVSSERRQHLAQFSSLRYKAMVAREKGARGILVVSGPASNVEEQLVELAFDASGGTSGIAAISLTDELAQRMLQAPGRQLSVVQQELDNGQPQMGFPLDGIEVKASIDIVKEKAVARNVLARMASADPAEPILVVGAHLDHLGRGGSGSSLARGGERGGIHYGADDNASGVSGVLEIAEYLVGQREAGMFEPQRDIVFALWSAEELGLLGSAHYIGQWGKQDLSLEVAAYLNMDMIGRLDDRLVIQGVGSSSVWAREIERGNIPIGLRLTIQKDSYLPTDATSFYLRRVPILSAFTGTHPDYHTPGDTADKLNYEGMQDVAFLMARITRALSSDDQEPDYIEMERPAEAVGRTRLRAYLGTIPDYAQGDISGVKLGGVIKGAPAEQAGLLAGDVVVEVAGKKIENIYDYTFALDALKIGEAVTIVVLRGDERVSLEVTPASRE